MARIPDKRQPFDPARAARERNEARAAAAVPPPTTPNRTTTRIGLRPVGGKRTEEM